MQKLLSTVPFKPFPCGHVPDRADGPAHDQDSEVDSAADACADKPSSIPRFGESSLLQNAGTLSSNSGFK